MAAPKLYEIRLPAGDCGGFDIDYESNTGNRKLWSRDWLSQGYDGVRLIGAGIGRTHMLPYGAWITLQVVEHVGIVQVEEMTIHAGRSRAVDFGQQNKSKKRPVDCQLRLIGMHAVADEPVAGVRTPWVLMGYNTDVYLQDVTLDATLAAEHASYWHGFADRGLLWQRVKVLGSGSQQCKVRSDTTETAPVVGAKIVVRDSTFKNYGQPWSWRGGAGIVVESGACDILVERCAFWGGQDNEHSHAIAISSEAFSYDTTGKVGTTGFGNGHVILRDIAVSGKSAVDWNNSVIRCARNSGEMQSAKSFTLIRSGVWGEKTQVQIGEVPAGKVKIADCNTPAIRDYCGHALGMSVDTETIYPGAQRKIPLSEGVNL